MLSDIKLEEINEDDFIIIDEFDLEHNQVLITNILSRYSLKNMSFEYYVFKLSGGLLSLIYNVDYYIPFSSLIKLLWIPVSRCKKQYHKIKTTILSSCFYIPAAYGPGDSRDR